MSTLDTTLPALVADPTCALSVPAESIPLVLAEVVAQEVKLATVKSILAARLATAGNGTPAVPVSADNLLDVREAARRLGMSPASVYRHADTFPFTRRPRPRLLRFSAAGIRRYLDTRRPG